MKKATNILFPTDFSDPAESAFRYALLFADQTKAVVQVLHVVYPQGEAFDYPMAAAIATQQQVDVERKKLKTFVDNGITQVLSQLKEAPAIDFSLEIGTPVNTICQIAERDDIDLVIMGSRGTNRSAFDKLMGSVASGVVTKAPCSVMVIPEEYNFKGIHEVAYASNVLESDPFEIWRAMELIKPANPVVNCVHINLRKGAKDKTVERMEQLKAFYSDRTPGIQVKFHHLPGQKLTHDLNEFVNANPIDLLIMYQPSHGFWDMLFHKSATKEMAGHTEVPLLVMVEED